jgi:hypothetical protein
MFYLWFTFYNMTSMSAYWAIVGDVLEGDTAIGGLATTTGTKAEESTKIGTFGHLAAGGTLGHMVGSSLASILVRKIGSYSCLSVISAAFFLAALLCDAVDRVAGAGMGTNNTAGVAALSQTKTETETETKTKTKTKTETETEMETETETETASAGILAELADQLGNVGLILDNPILWYSFLYQIFLSTSLGLTVIERTMAAKNAALGSDGYSSILAENQFLQGVIQFSMQFLGSG